MKRLACAAGVTGTLITTTTAATAAAAQPPTKEHVRKYERAYAHVVQVFGRMAAGCRLLDSCHGRVTDARMRVSTDVLHRMFAPPPVAAPVAAPAATATGSASVTPVGGGGGGAGGAGGVPACASESGTNYSTGPDNTNPSGASGRYQIMPFHWSTDCAGLTPTPAGQDQCAAIIYRNSGAGAWVGCGG